MPNRVSRRERRRRLYFLLAIMARATAVFQGQQPFNWYGMFAADPDTFNRWLAGREAVPLWIVQLAERAYRVPPPPPPSRMPLLVGTLLCVVALGAGAVFLLAR